MRYRDRDTGKFVSYVTWKRSKAHGGTRFVRERPSAKVSRKPLPRLKTRRGPKGIPQKPPPKTIKNEELLAIEQLLGEDFETLTQARRALREETEERHM